MGKHLDLDDVAAQIALASLELMKLRAYADALNARCVADAPDAERWRKLRDTPATSVTPGPLRGWLFSRPGGADSLDRMADALPPLVLPNEKLSGA